MKLKDRGFVEIDLDKIRHLRIDFTAARKIEELLGKPLSKISGENAGIKEMNTLFWAAMIQENLPDWTIERAEKMTLEAESFQYIMDKVTEAIELFFGDGQTKKN